jgi:ComF family protein
MDSRTRRRLGAARRHLDGWLDRWVPRGCALCAAPLTARAFPGFCVPCLIELPGARARRCPRCGLAHAGTCAPCADRPPSFDRTVAAADYAPPLDHVVTALKFGRQLALARPLGELLAAAWLGSRDPEPVDCLVPVPLGAARLSQRGFNQALEMARAMSAALANPLPVHAWRLRRLRDTPSQSDLDLAARRANLRGCFACIERLDGQRVGLVDDVMTSGSTLAEAAAALKAAGATRVVALVAARTA